MIIQCPQCQSRFKLPTEKTKTGGTKVRCTKCKSIFFITPLGASEKDASGKQPSNNSSDDWADFCKNDQESPGFSDSEKEPVDYFGDNFDAAEFFSQDEGEDSFFLNGEPASEPNLDEHHDLFSPQGEADSVPYDMGGSPLMEESPAHPETRLEVSAEPPKGEGADGGMPALALGENEPPPPPMDISPDIKRPQIPKIPGSLPDSARRKRSSAGRLLILLLLLILSAGVFLFYHRDMLPGDMFPDYLQSWKKKLEGLHEAVDLRPTELSGYHQVNSREGSLFVVRGKVVNHGPEPRAGIKVSGIVYDRSGAVVARQAAYCGNPFSRSELRSLSYERMTERMNNQFGEALSNFNIEPKKSVPFVIVFKGVPEEVAEFGVEVLDSKPVAK